MKQMTEKLVVVLCLVGLTSCKTAPANNRYRDPKASGALVDSQYSLQADRDKLEELRKEIPAEIKTANDEEAFIPQLLGDGTRPPQDIRILFDQSLRKKRELFDRDMTREREAFGKQNKKLRDNFLATQGKERADFSKRKPSRDRSSEFFKDQDLKRQNFFADERERSSDFDAQSRDKRKNFEDYTRAKTNEFNAEMRAYTKRYEDAQKAAREAGAKKAKSGN